MKRQSHKPLAVLGFLLVAVSALACVPSATARTKER